METSVIRGRERRATQRRRTLAEHGVISTRIRPGHVARLLDVSAGGALLETPFRLRHGTSVELRMDTHRQHVSVRGQVVRCAVTRLQPVTYRGAIQFEQRLSCFSDGEYRLPAANPVREGDRGEEATRDSA